MPVLFRNSDKDKEFFIDIGDGSGAEGVFVTLLPDKERDQIRKECTTRTANLTGVQEKLDATLFFHKRLQRAIKRWIGFVDLEGKEIPCTAETIRECAELNVMKFLEISDAIDRLADTGKAVTEKNSVRGRNGISAPAQ
jgi:hypothetical protein